MFLVFEVVTGPGRGRAVGWCVLPASVYQCVLAHAGSHRDGRVTLRPRWELSSTVLIPGLFVPQEFQNHMSEAQHLQRLVELQHVNQACLLSLLPMPRDTLERDEE